MINSALPVRAGHGLSLAIADRDERSFGIRLEQALEIGCVQSSVNRGDTPAGAKPQKRELQIVAVEVDDIEARHVVEDQLHQTDVLRQSFVALRIAPERLGTSCDEFRPRMGI